MDWILRLSDLRTRHEAVLAILGTLAHAVETRDAATLRRTLAEYRAATSVYGEASDSVCVDLERAVRGLLGLDVIPQTAVDRLVARLRDHVQAVSAAVEKIAHDVVVPALAGPALKLLSTVTDRLIADAEALVTELRRQPPPALA